MSLLQVNTIRNKTGSGAPLFDRGVNVSGTSDLGSVRVSSGIITASSGIVTYYGDARYLQNVGLAITTISTDLIIAGILTVTDLNGSNGNFSGILTASNINANNISASSSITSSSYYGNGSNLSGIVTSLVAGTNISISGSTGRVTISAIGGQVSNWDSNSVGIHTLSNVGIGTTNSSSKLTVLGNALINGITTSINGFFGDLNGNVTGTATTSINSNNTNITNDTSSTTNHYITFVSNLSGYRPQKVSSPGLTFVPSTSSLTINGSLGVGNTITVGNVVAGTGNFSGNVTAQDFNSLSDINLKKDINKLDKSLEKICLLEGVSYTWKSTEEKSIGLIAQEVEKVFPELVKDNSGIKTLSYSNLVAVLIEAVKELKQEIEDLKSNK